MEHPIIVGPRQCDSPHTRHGHDRIKHHAQDIRLRLAWSFLRCSRDRTVTDVEDDRQETLPQTSTKACGIEGRGRRPGRNLTPWMSMVRKRQNDAKNGPALVKLRYQPNQFHRSVPVMAIIPQPKLFSWEDLQPLGDLSACSWCSKPFPMNR